MTIVHPEFESMFAGNPGPGIDSVPLPQTICTDATRKLAVPRTAEVQKDRGGCGRRSTLSNCRSKVDRHRAAEAVESSKHAGVRSGKSQAEIVAKLPGPLAGRTKRIGLRPK